MLLENPATYVEFAASTWDEGAFLSEAVRRTGCALLLDVNNVHMCSGNHQRDARAAIRAMPLAQVGEIHLAGFAHALLNADLPCPSGLKTCNGADPQLRFCGLPQQRHGVLD